jgi:hypothetical protein
MSTTLAAIEAAGGTVTLIEGRLAYRNVPPSLMPDLTASRDAVLAAVVKRRIDTLAGDLGRIYSSPHWDAPESRAKRKTIVAEIQRLSVGTNT